MADILIANITNSTTVDATTGLLNGTGAFDALMNSVILVVNAQFEQNRISDVDYAQVLLGGMQSAMGQSIQVEAEKQKLILSKIPSVR